MKRSVAAQVRVWVAAIVVGGIIAGCAGDGSVVTGVPADAETPVAPPSAGAHASSSPTAASQPGTAATPPAGFEGLDVLLHAAFDDEQPIPLFLGESATGAALHVAGGRYVAEVANGDWQASAVLDLPPLADGVIQAEISLVGQGYAGLVARSTPVGATGDGMYVCLIDHSGWAGCVASHGESYADLFWSRIDGYAAGMVQTMRLTLVADRIELAVNGELIGSAVDASIAAGGWGVYAESLEQAAATVTFDNLTLARVPPGVEPFNTASD